MQTSSYAQLEAFTTKDGSTIRELMHTPVQSLAEALLAPQQATARHYHARSEELYSILEGGGELEVGGEARSVSAGDTVRIPPGVWHTLIAGREGARFLCCCAPPYADDDTFFA